MTDPVNLPALSALADAVALGDDIAQHDAVKWCVVKWTGPCYLGGEWHYCSRLADHIGDHGCECGDGWPAAPCRHSIYHHGCPSCDRQDPEDRDD